MNQVRRHELETQAAELEGVVGRIEAEIEAAESLGATPDQNLYWNRDKYRQEIKNIKAALTE